MALRKISNKKPASKGAYRIGIDVGGTFTDLVLVRPDRSIHLDKTATTLHDQSEGVLNGLARLADDGSGRLVVGLQGWVPDDRGQLEHRVELAAFWPESDLEVRIDSIPEELMHPSARVVPGTEDSSVIVLAPSYNCSGPLSWWEDGLTTEIVLPEGDFCPTLGPLLDLPSRTFVYSAWYGDEEYPDAHRIVVHGAGQELWSIERLRRGLSERPFHLLGAIALER